MFGRRRPQPDLSVLARVRDAGEVPLGTYPEDVLAVTGAYPRRGSLDHRPDRPSGGGSSFTRLDSHARQAALRAALDRLLADGTVSLDAATPLEDAVAAGLSGRLPVTGELGDLYQVCVHCRQYGFKGGVVIHLAVLEGVQMPAGVAAPGVETAVTVSAHDSHPPVLLVERADAESGTRSYALRTPAQEFTRLAAFLFADAIDGDQAIIANADMWFRFGQRNLRIENNFVRKAGEERAVGRLIMHADRKRKPEPRFITISAGELIEAMTRTFEDTVARAQ